MKKIAFAILLTMSACVDSETGTVENSVLAPDAGTDDLTLPIKKDTPTVPPPTTNPTPIPPVIPAPPPPTTTTQA